MRLKTLEVLVALLGSPLLFIGACRVMKMLDDKHDFELFVAVVLFEGMLIGLTYLITVVVKDTLKQK